MARSRQGSWHQGQGTGIAPVVTKLVARVWLPTAQHTRAVETLCISPTDQSTPWIWKGSHPHGHILGAPQPKSCCPGSLDWTALPSCSLCRWKANKLLPCLTSPWSCDIPASSARPLLTHIRPLKPHVVTQARLLFSPIKEPQPEPSSGISAQRCHLASSARQPMAPSWDLSPEDPSLPLLGPCCRQGGEEGRAAPQTSPSKASCGWAVGAAEVLSACRSVLPPPWMQWLLPKTRGPSPWAF